MSTASGSYAGRWWRKLEDGRIECYLCPRRCKLHEGQRAFCFVRMREGDQIVLTTYGRSTGFCVDPVEKKPLNHFLPGTSILSFGTAGCNLGCKFCQNWDISKSREIERLSDAATPEDIARAAPSNGCASVAFTYNDPVLWAEYAIDTARACHAHGIKAVAVTAGYVTAEARAEFFAPMDAANVDLKGFTDKFYKDACTSGAGGLQDVLDTLVWLKHESKVWFEITTLLIPDLNDSEQEVREECRWIRKELGPDVPLHFTAFHPDYRMLDRPRTPPDTLRRARQIGLEAGLHYVYTGNVHDVEGQTTYCPHCQAILVERDWFEIGRYRLKADGKCPDCATPIPGVWTDHPGSWGARRRAVRLSKG
ncbi:MAG: AmmeMemoRadiSam system radical SAM enzyme [Planctomycetota bacterium]|nr:MAG: AmmeMemoRadiSam system radical SAM enzyme [Planctomycetota bacterium]